MMEKKRSIGITIIGILAIIVGLLLLGICKVMLVGHPWSLWGLIVVVANAIGFIISGIFLLKLKNWARKLLLSQIILFIVINLWFVPTQVLWLIKGIKNVYSSFKGLILLAILTISPSIASIYYLTRLKVKNRFTAEPMKIGIKVAVCLFIALFSISLGANWHFLNKQYDAMVIKPGKFIKCEDNKIIFVYKVEGNKLENIRIYDASRTPTTVIQSTEGEYVYNPETNEIKIKLLDEAKQVITLRPLKSTSAPK